MSDSKIGSPLADQARELLCREFSRILDSGASTVRTRIVGRTGEPVEAWFYVHRDDGWHKEPNAVKDPELLRALQETVDMLVSRGHADEWSARRETSADWNDTDLKFHRDKLEERTGRKLESTLAGLLFRDVHDSKKDVRRNIHRRR